MNKLNEKLKQTERPEILPWRLHNDYPSRLPYIVPDFDVSTSLSELSEHEVPELSLETTKIIIETIIQNRGIQELCKLFLALIGNISEVKQVLLFQLDDANCIFTVIEAPVYDFSIRKIIYESEQKVMETILAPSIEFRLINSFELQEELVKIIPSDAKTLYEKK